MVSKARNGEFFPKHPEKYKGKLPLIYRSSWELTCFNTFDNHPAVLQWSSEPKSIQYRHPFTGRMSRYIPDFIVTFVDKRGKTHVEMIEVKPAKEALEEMANSKYDKACLIINKAKWAAAKGWAKKHGIVFRVLTERDIFRTSRR